ncbi:dihydrolipoamide acetyltransferase family protein [Georgenia sp. H159]|uniref:dihydrolipoamide acetyltransferase family protein n=1 Tax=Georgenia sp. H159 TaxID=3076115 RepID=UPI002D7864DA|nr:dihydrolipoamide acetyltransferase family protein [Georgenia sp. H159]
MPSYQQFKLPDVGEGLTEADIAEWHVAVGDSVTVNQNLVEIETAKSLVELPAPWAGVVTQILVREGETVPVGAPIVVIDVDPDGPAHDDGAPAADSTTSGDVLVGYGTKEASGARRRRRTSPASPAPAAQDPDPRPAEPAAEASGSRSPAPAGAPLAPQEPARVSGARAAEAAAARVPAPPAAVGAPSPGSVTAQPGGNGTARTSAPSPSVLVKPPVRKLAKDLGVDLSAVAATGPGGIITREDVLAHTQRSGAEELATYPGDDNPWLSDGVVSSDGRRTRVAVRSVRRRTAEAMVNSAFTAPHVTVFHTVDVTRSMKLVERLKGDRAFTDVRVTPLLLAAKALVLAVRRHPQINASWDDDAQEIVYKHYINLGIAAATPRGLVVPNIKDAHRLDLHELATAIADLTATAREGRTTPQAMSDGTITITNVGVFGIDTGTPILNPGESAILAFGAIRKQPWVHKDKVKPRWVTQLALSFDHRLVDGELGARVLADVARLLENPDMGLVWS